MNAFTIGNRKNAAIAVTDGLLRNLDRNEFSAVMAHEISHLKHNDLRIMGFAALSSQLVQMLAFIGQLLLLINLPLLLLGQYTISWAAILMLIVAPSLSALLHLALSRTREYRADIGAADLMGDGRTLASALAKIENFQKRYVRAMLWPGYRPIPAGHLLRTHPPTKERIKRLMGYPAQRPHDNGQRIVTRERISPQILSQMPRRWSWTN
jgi:heat shock protein HtpX